MSDTAAEPRTEPERATGYPRKRARTRRQLMDAGMGVLADHGPDGTTVGEVARRARVSPGTFYNHFDDRDALIGAVVDELAGGVEISGEQLRSVEHDAAARVVIGTRQLMALARDQPATARAFVTLLAAVPAFRTRVRAIVRSAIDDGIAQGRFEPRPSLVTTDALLGAVVQWMRTRLAGEADATAEAAHLELALGIAGLPRADVDAVIAAATA